MSRWVVPKREGLKAGDGEPPSGPSERIAKYIPGEIISAYTMIYGLLVSYNGGAISETQGDSQNIVVATIIVILIFFVVNIVYLQRNPNQYSRRAHYFVSSVAFVAWVYPISSALLGSLFHGLIAILLQAAAIALALAVDPKEPGSA